MHMHEARVQGSDPQTAVAIPQQLSPVKLGRASRKRVGLEFLVNELLHSVRRADQELSVLAFGESIVEVGQPRWHQFWHGIVLRRTRLPSPEPVACAQPEIPPAVLIEGRHAKAEGPV